VRGADPGARHPIAGPRTRFVCPGISCGPAGRSGGKIRSPGSGRKKGSGFPTWGNYGGQTVRISPAEGWGGSWSGEAGAWVGRLGDYGGQTV